MRKILLSVFKKLKSKPLTAEQAEVLANVKFPCC